MSPQNLSYAVPDDLIEYIIGNMFEQPRLDSISLIRGRLADGRIRTWLYKNNEYQEIFVEDHEKFRQAAKTRGGNYSVELCEFVIEQVLPNGDVTVNFWRRVRDHTGEGGRVILSCRGNG